MQFMESNVQLFTPDTDGLAQFKVTGDQIQAIQKAVFDTYLSPPPKLLAKYNKDIDAYNKKYPDKSFDNPNPPDLPAATGIPGDFMLVIASMKQKTGRATTVQALQETTVYKLYGSASAKQFLIEKCGIPV